MRTRLRRLLLVCSACRSETHPALTHNCLPSSACCTDVCGSTSSPVLDVFVRAACPGDHLPVLHPEAVFQVTVGTGQVALQHETVHVPSDDGLLRGSNGWFCNRETSQRTAASPGGVRMSVYCWWDPPRCNQAGLKCNKWEQMFLSSWIPET